MTAIDPTELTEALQLIQERKAAQNAAGARDVFFRCQIAHDGDGDFPNEKTAQAFSDGITQLVAAWTEAGILVEGSARFDIVDINQEFTLALGDAFDRAKAQFIASLT